MDDNPNSKAVQNSMLQVFKDAFVPQPHRRTKAWERAHVEARVPRLRGQKIWKKVGTRTRQDDKENFETAIAELEKGGIGARKKRRIMGAKENINDAQWELIGEGSFTNTNVVLSPQKKGGNSLMADNTGALLVPRKRTNANHLITPRKPLRRIPNGNKLNMTSAISPAKNMKEENPENLMDGRNKLLSSDSVKINDTTDVLSENSELRRKSLRRSTRRLTQNDIQVIHDTSPGPDHVSSSLSVVICSAPVFDTYQNAQVMSDVEAPTSERVSNSSEEVVSNLTAVEAGPPITNDESTLFSKDLKSLDESRENASGEDCVQAPIDTKKDVPIFEEASSAVPPSDSHGNNFISANQEVTTTTPNHTIDIEGRLLDPVNEYQAVNSATSTRAMTPKSKRSTPRVASQRSTRASRSKSFTPVSANARSTGEATMDEINPTNEASSLLRPYGPQRLSAEPESQSMAIHYEPAVQEPTEAVSSTDDAAISTDEDFGPCVAISVEDSNSTGGQDPASVASHPAGEIVEDIEAGSDFVALPLHLTLPSAIHSDIDNDMEHETPVISELGVASMVTATLQITEPATISMGMDHIVNLFPALQSDKYESYVAQTEAVKPFKDAVEEPEALKAVPPTPIGLGNVELQGSDETISILATESGINNGEVPESEPRLLVDHDDTDLLRDFVTRVKASRAAKAVTNIPKRKRSLPHSPIRLPLGEANSSPTGADLKDDEFDVGELAPSSNKRRKHNEPLPDEDELAEPILARRSNRTRLPVKKSLAAPSFIPVRRFGQDGDNTVTLRRSEDKELAALTRMNTRKNKGAAVHPSKVLAKKAEEKDDPASRQRALKEVFDQKKKESKKGKTVVWAEELAQFQTMEGKKEMHEPESEKAKVVEEKKTAVKVGMRSKMSLGMAVNGTPAPKRKMRGRS